MVLASVENCAEDAHAWAPDVANALTIITSQATPQVKAHLLAPIVKTRWLLESCFLSAGWDSIKSSFSYPLEEGIGLQTAQQELAVLKRARLAGTVRWQPVEGVMRTSSMPLSPPHSVYRHSPSYAGLGLWLERLLRATGAGGLPPPGDRNSFGAAGDRSSVGSTSVHGSQGFTSGADLADADRLRIYVWCGALKVHLPVPAVLTIASAALTHTEALMAFISRAAAQNCDDDGSESWASCDSARDSAPASRHACNGNVGVPSSTAQLAALPGRVCAHMLVQSVIVSVWCCEPQDGARAPSPSARPSASTMAGNSQSGAVVVLRHLKLRYESDSNGSDAFVAATHGNWLCLGWVVCMT